MTEGVVQRRGVPQAEALADRFGQPTLGAPVDLPAGILPVAKVTRVDFPSMGGINVLALAANRSMIQLFNPAGSNTELILKRIWVSQSVTGTMALRTHDTALTNNSTAKASMVRKEGSVIAPIGQVRHVQGAAVGTGFSKFQLEANVGQMLDFRIGDGEQFDGLILQPGRGVLAEPGGDNVTLRITFQWLERPTG